MISARRIPGPATTAIALAAGLLLSGCYYGYPAYPAYPSYPAVGTTYTQREFTVPASGAAAVSTSPATLPPQYEYAVGTPYSDYYQTYPYPYPYYPYYPYYPPYAAYPYYGYGYPAVAFSFGYWGGSGCCWHGNGWHGNGWHGGGWHGGGGGWHGGGSTWQGSGGGWHGGGGSHAH